MYHYFDGVMVNKLTILPSYRSSDVQVFSHYSWHFPLWCPPLLSSEPPLQRLLSSSHLPPATHSVSETIHTSTFRSDFLYFNFLKILIKIKLSNIQSRMITLKKLYGEKMLPKTGEFITYQYSAWLTFDLKKCIF